MDIRLDDLAHPQIAVFLEAHLEDMRSVSPPESKHALDLDALRKPDIRFYTGWEGDLLLVCGAIKILTSDHGEIKSMRSLPLRRGEGLGSQMLQHLLSEARQLGIKRLSLETGSMPFFYPAHTLYRKFGFTVCNPFHTYKSDPNSVFFSLDI